MYATATGCQPGCSLIIIIIIIIIISKRAVDFPLPTASRVFMFTQLFWSFPSGVQRLEYEAHTSLLRVYDVLSAIHYTPSGVVKNLTLP
jgi:hypothetical protein